MTSADEIRPFLEEQAVIERWRNLISTTALDSGCRIWTGAISSKGHGRFWVGQRTDGRDLVMIAHRFGYAVTYGLDALLAADVIRHLCDEPSCQTPTHWAAGTAAENTTDWWQRHHTPGSPLRDTRGPRGRAEALRTAALTGTNLQTTANTGLPLGDRLQPTLW